MSDLIKRQDAIRAVAEVLSLNRFASFKNIKDFGRFAERMLRNVPSADRPQTSDLINGAEMLKRLHTDLCYGIACKDCSMCTEDGGCRVEEWIDTFPSADRPQGEWIFRREFVEDTPFTGYRCSNCNYWQGMGAWNFCPHCGCRMKGADDE